MELAPGSVLAGRFEVDGPPLGAGASGVVYPAIDRATGRKVAAKLLHPERATDAVALARLQDEAAIAGRLSHPNVVEVLGLWSDGPGRWVLVSERVDGLALTEVGRLAPQAVVALGLEIAAALEAAAAVGLVHGDVRPGNVLLSSTGARLFDFGVGRLAAQPRDSGPGTDVLPAQTAPERLDGGPVSRAADVYGLGVILHFALHGTLPFDGPTPWAVIGAQRQRLPATEGPRGLVDLCRELLHPDPVERPDLAMARQALERLRVRPDGRLRMHRPMPPIRPSSAWAVYGVDPGTGAPAVIRTGLSKRQARGLLRRLRAEGWQVRGVREAFGWRDLWFLAALMALGAVFLPLIGLVPALWFGLRWRADAIRPFLATALPPVSVPVPPKVVSSGTETALVSGVLMLTIAAALAWWPIAAVLPAVLLALVVSWSLRSVRTDPEVVARRGRVATALAELRTVLDTRPLQLEDALGLAGEIDLLESDWNGGRIDADRVLVRVDDLMDRASRSDRAGGTTDRSPPRAEGPSLVLEALRRPRS